MEFFLFKADPSTAASHQNLHLQWNDRRNRDSKEIKKHQSPQTRLFEEEPRPSPIAELKQMLFVYVQNINT